MKPIQNGFVIALILLVVAFSQLPAAAVTNTPASFQESWQTLSNRWSLVPLEKIKQAAGTNDVTAQYYLGNVYCYGFGMSKDDVEAFKWMNLAAQQGMARAQRKLGWMLQTGLGVETNVDEAVEWYQKAAQQNDAQAQFNLGWMYENGVSVEQNYTNAAEFYRLAAEQEHALAQNNLGWLYKNGMGVLEDQLEAVKWFQKAAEQGETRGQINLAWVYAGGVYGATNTFGQGAVAQVKSGGIAPNHELAEKWMRKAVDLNSAEGQFQFAQLLHGEFNDEGTEETARFPEAAKWYQKAAEQGHARAQYELADMLNTGQLGDDQRTNCIPWFLKAAAQGNAKAQAELGRLRKFYPDSELLKSISPIDSLKKAAKQNDLSAQFDLAFRYHHGDGVPKDDIEAFKWMEKASQNDWSLTLTINAQYYLGVMYETGEGVPKNLTKAFRAYLFYWNVFLGGNKPPYVGNMAAPYYRLGRMFEKGEGVPQDDNFAATNYFMATKFGFSLTSDDTARCTAIENLLNLYVHGRGLPGDTNMISQQLNDIKWNQPVTTVKGQYLFGQIYRQGKVVPKNLVEAAAWLRVATDQKSSDAQKELAQVEAEMSPEQKTASYAVFEKLNKRIQDANRDYKQFENVRKQEAW